MKKKGFIATSLIYSFVLVFLLLMTLTINNLVQNNNLSSKFSVKVKEDIQNKKTKPFDNRESMINYIRYMIKDYPKDAENIIKLKNSKDGSCENTLAYDGTADNNLRYVGGNPCNYLKFNNETWRIIGIMENVDNGLGIKESRIKIVRSNPLGRYMFDNTGSDGVGDYFISDIMKELNTDYLIQKSGTTSWPELPKTDNYNYSNGLSEESQKLIGNAVWYLGSTNGSKTASKIYEYERSFFKSSIVSKTWTGKVGLLYSSDVPYTIGSNQRKDCLKMELTVYNKDCYKTYIGYTPKTLSGSATTWVINSYEYGIKPVHFSFEYFSPYIPAYNHFTGQDANMNAYIFPTLYLNANVSYAGGDGSVNNPYTLK